MNRILILDKSPERLSSLQKALSAVNVSISVACSRDAAIELIEKHYFHLCLWSVDSFDAISDISLIRKMRPVTTVIVMSENNDTSHIVSCMRAGAAHYWKKNDALDALVAITHETLNRTASDEQFINDLEFPFPEFVGRHPKIIEVFRTILSIRKSDSTVLVTGESGTGKEVVARAIHNLSNRKHSPWVAINCGAIPANLLESELFGHTKGAFTGAIQNRIGRFQMAGHGTLFLDEIGDLSLDLQAKILRALQNRVFEPVGCAQSATLDARIIAATNQDLHTAVTEKRFRQDLFYRLNVIPIFIPPLRNRKSDIPLLAKRFIEKFCDTNHKEFFGISEEAMQCLMDYSWPGNVRELENMMERVVVLKQETGMIELKDLPVQHFEHIRYDRFVANVALPEEGMDLNAAVADFENELIIQALHKTEGNKNKAARLLNLNRTTLVEKLKRKGIRV